MTYYREYYDLRSEDYPNTERILSGTVSLPIYYGLRDAELKYVVDSINEILDSV